MIDLFNQYNVGSGSMEIDPDHPWVQNGLLAFFDIEEGGGARVYDSCGNLSMPLLGGPTWVKTGSGTGLSCAGTAGQVGAELVGLPIWFQKPPPLSIACGFRRLGAVNNNSTLANILSQTVNNISTPIIAIQYLSTNFLFVQFGKGASSNNLTSTQPVISVGSDHVASATWQSQNNVLYQDGLLAASDFVNTSSQVYQSTCNIGIGLHGAATNFSANSIIYWAGFWASALPASAHAEIGASVNAIRQIFRRRRHSMVTIRH